jgi:hypothetical protein
LEILPDDVKDYAEIISSTLKEGPNAVLTPTNSAIVSEVYKNIIGYTDDITGKFVSSKSKLIKGVNIGNDTENTKKKRKISAIRLNFLKVVNSYHDKVFHRS